MALLIFFGVFDPLLGILDQYCKLTLVIQDKPFFLIIQIQFPLLSHRLNLFVYFSSPFIIFL